MVEINWLEEARQDLIEIFDFIQRDSSKYAHFQIEKIVLGSIF